MSRTSEGLLCVTRTELQTLQLTHLLSGMDADEGAAPVCGTATTLSGYTEWISPQAASLTLGWDWHVALAGGGVRLMRLGLPRTNIQMLDAGLQPLPWDANLQALAEFIDQMEWATPALGSVSLLM